MTARKPTAEALRQQLEDVSYIGREEHEVVAAIFLRSSRLVGDELGFELPVLLGHRAEASCAFPLSVVSDEDRARRTVVSKLPVKGAFHVESPWVGRSWGNAEPSAFSDKVGHRADSTSRGVPLIDYRKRTCRVASAAVPLTISRVGETYLAEVTPPHAEGEPWSSPRPMGRDDLVAALRQIGCHQTDIGDAFFDADPEWLNR